MDAAINSGTPVTDYMNMPVLRSFETRQAICAVCERRANAINTKSKGGGTPKPRKVKKKRKR